MLSEHVVNISNDYFALDSNDHIYTKCDLKTYVNKEKSQDVIILFYAIKGLKFTTEPYKIKYLNGILKERDIHLTDDGENIIDTLMEIKNK